MKTPLQVLGIIAVFLLGLFLTVIYFGVTAVIFVYEMGKMGIKGFMLVWSDDKCPNCGERHMKEHTYCPRKVEDE